MAEMDPKEEYHDPDYPGTSGGAVQGGKELSEDEKVNKIKVIIRREFGNELAAREAEVNTLDQRIASARHLMHRLRYTLVRQHYRQWQLELAPPELADELAGQVEPRAKAEVSSLLRDTQRALHPSLRKLLGGGGGGQLADVLRAGPRHSRRRDYQAMVHSKNVTTAADATTSLRPSPSPSPAPADPAPPRKVPRQLEPKVESVFTLNEATRNEMKDRYRIIVGNTSKYAPAASPADRSSHKWLLYVRGAAPGAAQALLAAVAVTLHPSYAPHHKLTLTKPPFHVSRRGWGEFPARVELHFPLPARNPPAALEHTLRLDTRRTGLQTLGAETVVDVWLHSTPEMLPFIYRDPAPAPPLAAPAPAPALELESLAALPEPDSSWLDFFSNARPMNVDDLIIRDTQTIDCHEQSIDSKLEQLDYENAIDRLNEEKTQLEIPPEILNKTTSPKKKIMKYVDPATGKVYYLEMDRNLDLSKVQEIVINPDTKISPQKMTDTTISPKKHVTNNAKKNGVTDKSRSLLKSQKQIKIKSKNYTHIPNDHCYLGANWAEEVNFLNVGLPDEKNVNRVASDENVLLDNLKSAVKRLKCVRVAVNYLLGKIPLVSSLASDGNFVKQFPFVVRTEEAFWRLDEAKRRNIEWSRAKLINTLLLENLNTTTPIWRTKQILIFSRLHGYSPARGAEWESDVRVKGEGPGGSSDDRVKGERPEGTLSVFEEGEYMGEGEDAPARAGDEDDVDVIGSPPPPPKLEDPPAPAPLQPLPAPSSDERLRQLYIERRCAELGIELRNEDVGHGYCYSAVHAVILRATQLFAEELLRGALAETRGEARGGVWGGPAPPPPSLSHVARAARAPRLRVMTSRALAAAAAELEPL